MFYGDFSLPNLNMSFLVICPLFPSYQLRLQNDTQFKLNDFALMSIAFDTCRGDAVLLLVIAGLYTLAIWPVPLADQGMVTLPHHLMSLAEFILLVLQVFCVTSCFPGLHFYMHSYFIPLAKSCTQVVCVSCIHFRQCFFFKI